jgi:hypothetical protein
MNPQIEALQSLTRRHFLGRTAHGLGAIALGSLLKGSLPAAAAAATPPVSPVLTAHSPRFPGRAKRVIYLHLTGSPPHLDLFDYKPELVKRNGQDCPDAFLKGKRFAFTSGTPKLLGTPRTFARHGQGGVWLSDAIPHLHTVADELCVIRSMTTDQFNHAPAELLVYTGSPRPGRPSIGSWVTYGLGTENQNLPGFVVLISSGVQPNGGKNSFGNGFLPSVYQGVQCRSKGDPVLYASDPAGMDRDVRRMGLDTLRELNELQSQELGHPETATRIAQYELAFRMQMSVPEATAISGESEATRRLYGLDAPSEHTRAYGRQCLVARRLIERGVRFVELTCTRAHGNARWDAHGDLRNNHSVNARAIDQPIAGLLTDLKARGLLEETVVLWSGEFGRTPFAQGRDGRDHNPHGFSLWMAGGGIRGGMAYGSTDEYGYKAAENPVEIHDLHATLLHLLGIDHERLTYRFGGRDHRLTDVHGRVIQAVLA